MKRYLLLVLLVVGFAIGNSQAQAPRKPLAEEFTSSTCPPCAATDPMMQKFQSDYSDKMVVLKWHVNWPSPGNDPMYTVFPGSVNRSTVYYNNPYAPQLFFDGTLDAGLSSSVPYATVLEGIVDSIAATKSPFTINISQQIVVDSLIINLTVKSVGPLPTATDLRLGVVVGERYLVYMGTNGLPSHDYVVRTTVPSLVSSTGALGVSAAYPAFSITQGGTNTYRYAAKIGATWNRGQLFSAAFIQSVAAKEVYQSEWTIPSITAVTSGISDLVIAPTTDKMQVTLTNNTATAQNVGVSYSPDYNSPGWSVAFSGLTGTGNSLSLNAGESKTVDLTLTAPSPAIGSSIGSVIFSTSDGLRLGGQDVTFFGNDNTDVLVDGGAGIAPLGPLLDNSLNNNGLKAGLIGRDLFMNGFTDWAQFKTVCIAAGYGVGIQVGTNEWQNLSDHLAAGGNVLFTGPITIGIYQSSGVDSYMQYWRDNFHIDPTAYASTTWGTVTGVTGDPIGDGISATLSPKNTYRQGLLSYDDAFQSIFTNEKKDIVGMKALSNGGKVVYLTYELENLPKTQQPVVSKRIIDWFNSAADVKQANSIVTSLSNYPNPVSSETKFSYTLAERAPVTLVVHDVLGREVGRLVNATQDAGSYNVNFDASKLATGTYVYTLNAGGKTIEKTMTVTK